MGNIVMDEKTEQSLFCSFLYEDAFVWRSLIPKPTKIMPVTLLIINSALGLFLSFFVVVEAKSATIEHQMVPVTT